jgi:hypothetical protein
MKSNGTVPLYGKLSTYRLVLELHNNTYAQRSIKKFQEFFDIDGFMYHKLIPPLLLASFAEVWQCSAEEGV